MIDLKYIKYVKEIEHLKEVNFYCNNDYIINCMIFDNYLMFTAVRFNDKCYCSTRYKVVNQALELLSKDLFLIEGCKAKFYYDSEDRDYLLKFYSLDYLHAVNIYKIADDEKNIYFNNDVMINIHHLISNPNRFMVNKILYDGREFNFYSHDEYLYPFSVKLIINLLNKECKKDRKSFIYDVVKLYHIRYNYLENAVVNVDNKTITLFYDYDMMLTHYNIIKNNYKCFMVHDCMTWLTFSKYYKKITNNLILNELDYKIIDCVQIGGENNEIK